MDQKLFLLYDLIPRRLFSKNELAAKLGVTTKTIENKIKLTNGDIVYRQKLGAYHFASTLPKMISLKFLFEIISNSIENVDLSHDLKILSAFSKNTNTLIETSTLSEILQTLVSLQIAINHNLVLSINYIGNDNINKNKIIQPNQIIYSNNKHYLYITYDKKNKKNIGEKRTLFINSISNIKKERYEQNSTFQTNYRGNAFGKYLNDKYAELVFCDAAARYIKREHIQSMHYEIIKEDFSGNKVFVKYYYNNILELILLLQTWMPSVYFVKNDEFAKDIYKKIENNFQTVLKRNN